MDITVVLCTYNRCSSLAKALDSVAVSTLPQSVEWEVLLVDNNSSDHTREVASEFCKRYPGRFRYLFETQPGLSNARNAGIREASGHIIVFMDDDVIVEPTWLQNLTATLHNNEWAGAGGRILPEWTCSPPRWLSPEGRHAAGPLVAFHPTPEAGQLNEPPIGANMAFRANATKQVGPFDERLGPGAGGHEEETEMSQRMRRAGFRIGYAPKAIVYHEVDPSRANRERFIRIARERGRCRMLHEKHSAVDVIVKNAIAMTRLRIAKPGKPRPINWRTWRDGWGRRALTSFEVRTN